MASNLGGNSGDPPATTTRTPEELEGLKKKLKDLEEEKATWQEEIKYWERKKALRQRQLADLTGTDEVRRAELERWLTREELEEEVQYAENHLHDCQQGALRAEAALAATAAALLHQGPTSDPPPSSDDATPSAPDSSPETDEQLLSKALDKGGVDVQSSDSVIAGVAGSGKTHSLAMALEEELPSKRESTPCAKAPVRAVTQTRVGVKEMKLRRADGQYFFSMAMRTAKVSAYALRGYTPPLHIAETVDSNTPNYMYALEEEMIRCVKNEETYSDLLCEFRWCKMTDSGGQPQFLEVLPIFLHHISLGIITIKLNERLDHHPMVQFYKDGQPLGESYRSCYTHEQIIRYCMRALISQGQGKLGIKFLFLGTHLDLVEDSVGESLQDKNRKLKEMVASFKMVDNVVYCNNGFDVVYAINAKNPGPSDWEVMKQVREVIAKSSNVPPIRFPIKWYALELALVHHVQETKQSVLLESECLRLARTFHFDEPNLKAALRYLHQAKLIFYYEEGHLVIADIQFILNKLSEMVVFNIQLCSNPSRIASLDKIWRKFRYYGILHLSCLDKFPEGYIEGVFSPKELVQLFIHLCIVSEVGPEEYLMPCLLAAEEEACCNPEPETQAVPSMALEFPEGGPMLGSFCGLVCYLMSVKGWKLVEDATEQPYHLTRSSIHFRVPERQPGKITINDPLSTFLLVTFHGNPKVASKMCPLVRETVLVALEEVSKTLNYFPRDTSKTNSLVNKPHVTFLCPCKGSPLHPAVMSKCGELLSCPYDPLPSEDVTEKHRIWFGGDLPVAPQQTSSPAVSGTLTCPDVCRSEGCVVRSEDVGFLMEHLHQSAYKWREIGTALSFHPGELENINQAYPKGSPEQLLAELLSRFSQWPTITHNIVPTLKKLCNALRSGLVGLGAQANTLQDRGTQLPSWIPASSHPKATPTASPPSEAIPTTSASSPPKATLTASTPPEATPTTSASSPPKATLTTSTPPEATPTTPASSQPNATPTISSQPDATPTTSSQPDATPTASSQPDAAPTASSQPDATPTTSSQPDATPTTSSQPDASSFTPTSCSSSSAEDVDGAVTKNQTPLSEPCMESRPPSQDPPCTPPLHAVTPPSQPQATPSQSTLASPLTPSDPSSWSVEDVCSWLTSQGLQKFVEIFRENEVDGECLLTMDHELLKDGLGMKALGDRSKILKKVKELKK